MSGKKENFIKSATRPPKRRKNSEEISVNTSVGKPQAVTTSIGVRKVDRSQSLKHEEAGKSRKSEIKDQNLLLRTNSELRSSLRSKAIEENPRITVKKKSPRSVSQKTLRTTEHSKASKKQTSPKRSNTQQPIAINEVPEQKSTSTKNVRNTIASSESSKVCDEEIDPSKLTLAERVKLFNEKIATEKAMESKNRLYSGNEIGRKNWPASRSRTQPITCEELKAAYQKPLAPRTNRHSMFEHIDGARPRESICTILKVPAPVLKEESNAFTPSKRSDTVTSSKIKTNSLRKPVGSLTGITECNKEGRNTSISRVRASSKEGTNEAKASEATFRSKPAGNTNQIEKTVRKNERINKQVAHKYLKKKTQTIANEVSPISDQKTKSKMEKKSATTLRKIDDTRSRERSSTERIAQNTSASFDKVDHRTFSTALDSKSLMTDTTLTMTRLVQEVNSMEIRSISIANRLAALEQNGRSKWKHQVPCESDLHTLTLALPTENDSTDGNILPKTDLTSKQGKLAERLEKLETASETWRRRVATPDAVQYSIYGKMKLDHSDVFQSGVSSPLIQAVGNEINKGKKIPRAERFRVEKGVTTQKIHDTQSVSTVKKSVFSRRIIEDDESGLLHSRSDLTVAVPRIDDLSFTTFFSGIAPKQYEKECIDLKESDFDIIKSHSEL